MDGFFDAVAELINRPDFIATKSRIFSTTPKITMHKKSVLIAALALALWALLQHNFPLAPADAEALTQVRPDSGDSQLQQAFERHASNIQVQGQGNVIKLLPDDNHGSRHQKFLLRLASGQTLLVAHNIDLAPKIEDLQVGDTVVFSGEYEWNAKGGTVHWTHHDPKDLHEAGWLKHNGTTYQ